MKRQLKNIILLAAFMFVASGCSIMKNLDEAAAKLLSSLDQPIGSSTFISAGDEFIERKNEAEKADYNNLTRLQKKAIDEWLSENGLNRYGDSEETNYAGGTPLVNESTGDSINRFEYILERIPDILEKIEK